MTDASGTSAAAETDPGLLVAAAMRALHGNYGRRDNVIRAYPEIQAINTAADDIRRQCILVAAREQEWAASRLLHYIARKKAGLTVDDIETILPPPVSQRREYRDMWVDAQKLSWLAGQIEATWKSADDAARARLLPQLERVAAETSAASTATRLRKLTMPAGGERVPYHLVDETSAAGQALRAVFGSAPEPVPAKAALVSLLATYPVSGKPGAKWRTDAAAVLKTMRQPDATIGALLDAALDAPDYVHKYPGSTYRATRFATERDEAILCGTALLAGRAAATAPELLPRLRRLALKAITMIGGPNGSPRSVRLANHCVQAIADAGLPSSVTELLKTERGTRHGTLLRAVRTAIDTVAGTRGLTRDELLELAVEEHGLGPDGTRRVPLPDGWTAVIGADARTANVSYEDRGGKLRKSLSASVRQAAADTLNPVNKDLKAIRTTIGNERTRLDSALAADRSWPLPQWRQLYLDHPVTGRLTRALIWTFSGPADAPGEPVTGIPVSTETLVTSDGDEVPVPDSKAARVRLWHPVHAGAEEVRAWRRLLIGRQLVQPVKQAFREVYVLTPAEETTGTYSNRFAGHIFRQAQARALMKGRAWKPVTLAWYDDGIDHGVARRDYPSPDGTALRAGFFFDPADHDDLDGDLIRYCASDQVRFFRADSTDSADRADTGGDDAVPLTEVPPLIFSEAMRDIDLFIGVTSIGADPEWSDRGRGRRFGDYWHSFAFGDLGASAEVRREILAGLLPMLAIAARCDLEDRFLKVQGDLRTYRIHLGSGNILMSPNDQYLCIVAARSARAGKLFLPFDDDPVLSLILSKAFLLAADAAITDETITRQIRRK